MADKKEIQSRLFDATGNGELSASLASAICDKAGFENLPESRLGAIEIAAKKAASEAETTQSIDAFKRASGSIPSLPSYGIRAFESLDGFLTLLLGKAEYTSGAVIHGSAGVGKSMRVLRKLSAEGVDYAYFNTYSTPLSLVEAFFRNNGKVIVIDDVNNLLKEPKAVAILKAATFSAAGERIITYQSTSKVLEERGIPSSFIFRGKVIIILNEIPATLRETFQALMSRMYSHEVVLTLEEKSRLISEVFRTKEDLFGLGYPERDNIIQFMCKAVSFGNAHKYNVRTALRAAEMVSKLGFGRASPMILDMLGCDLKLKTFLMIAEKSKKADLTVQQQVEIWTKATGYSRRAFFEVKSKYFNTYYGHDAHESEISSEIDRLVCEAGKKNNEAIA